MKIKETAARVLGTAMIFTAILSSGCSKSLENTYSSQESRIDSFLESTRQRILTAVPEAAEGEEGYEEYIAYQELIGMGMGQIIHNRNSNRIILYPGRGASLSSSGKVTVYYAIYTFNGSVNANNLVFTNSEEIASESKWEVTEPSFEPVTVALDDKRMVEGLRNGLEGIKAGEECYIVFSGKYGYGNKVHGTIPANSALLYYVKAVAIQ